MSARCENCEHALEPQDPIVCAECYEALAAERRELIAIVKAARRKLRGTNIMGETIEARWLARANAALAKAEVRHA